MAPDCRGVAWAGIVNLLGGATGSVLTLLLAVVVGRQLGTDGAGTYFLVVAAFMIVANVAELGADTGLVRFVSAARATGRITDVPALVRLAVVPVAVVGCVVIAVTAVCAPFVDVDALSPVFLVVAAACAVMLSMTAVMLAITRGLGDVLTYPALQNLALPLLRVLGVVGAVAAGAGVSWALGAWMAPVPLVLLLASVVAWRLVAHQVADARPHHDAGVSRRAFWGFSAARGVAAAVEILLEWADVLIVGALTSPAEAGVYAVVTRCVRAGEVVQQAARIAVGPQISSALARRDHDEARQLYGLVTAAMIWLAWPFFGMFAIFGDTVLDVFGTGFDEGAVSLAVLAGAMAFSTAAGTVQTILLMGGRSSWQLADKAFALVLNLVLNLMLVPGWGIEGAAVAWAVTIVADTLIVVWQVQRMMGIRPDGRHVLMAVVTALGVVGGIGIVARLAFGSSMTVFVATLVVAATVYLAVSWKLREALGLTAILSARFGS